MSIKFSVRIESYDVQHNGNIKISSLLKILQKAAGDDVNNTPLNFFALAEKRIAFVLTKMTLEIFSDIKIYDELTIISHPRKVHGASFPRDFIIKRNDMIVANARSMWVLLDLDKRSILRPSVLDSIGELPPSDDDMFEIDDIRRIVDVNSLSRTDVLSVKYHHLDMNNHLNNTFYSDFIFDNIDNSEKNSDEGLYLQINYKTEALLGNTIEIYSSFTDGYDFVAKNIACDKICFTAYVNYRNK